jgi:hypothetical protein
VKVEHSTWENHVVILEEIHCVAMQIMAAADSPSSSPKGTDLHDRYARLWARYSEMMSQVPSLLPASADTMKQIEDRLAKVKDILVPLKACLQDEKGRVAGAMNRVKGGAQSFSRESTGRCAPYYEPR